MLYDTANALSTAPLPNGDESPQRETKPDAAYSHILVPTGMADGEISSLTLGLQLATAHRARLTLLHVLPELDDAERATDPQNPIHWLDAIENLHRSLAPAVASARTRERLRNLAESQTHLKAYLERHCSLPVLSAIDARLECRRGDVADEILQFCHAESVDLVILISQLSRWSLPVVPGRVHRVLQQARQPVIVVRPQKPADGERIKKSSA